MGSARKNALTFGTRLRLARVNQGMSAVELAGRLGCSATYVRNVERGATNISLSKASEFSDAVNRELHELLGGDFIIKGD